MQDTNGGSSFVIRNLLCHKNILIVDDDDDYGEALKEIFIAERANAVSKKDPVCALKYAVEQDWDLILIDKNMPNLDGLEFIEQIREHKPTVNIVLITAYPNEESRKKCLDLGVRYYLAKPFRKNDLLEIASFIFL